MSFNKTLIKFQFKVDHVSLAHRAALLSALLLIVVVPWFFLIYQPQAQDAALVAQQISDLKTRSATLRERNRVILQHAQSHDMDKVIAQYQHVKDEVLALDQKLARYQHRYVDDKVLAKLLYALLKDIRNVSIENFSTTASNDVVIASPIPASSAPASAAVASAATTASATTPGSPSTPPPSAATKPADTAPKAPEPAKNPASPTPNPQAPVQPQPALTHYTLSLKGDYFSIAQFLQRIEQLKWQLFWSKLSYQVDDYPHGIATIEFYTLKPSAEQVGPVPATPAPGAKNPGAPALPTPGTPTTAPTPAPAAPVPTTPAPPAPATPLPTPGVTK